MYLNARNTIATTQHCSKTHLEHLCVFIEIYLNHSEHQPICIATPCQPPKFHCGSEFSSGKHLSAEMSKYLLLLNVMHRHPGHFRVSCTTCSKSRWTSIFAFIYFLVNSCLISVLTVMFRLS